ncbi:molybdopterin converting factor subunit 1 [Caldimonas brevitalea]|uniref:Molybdopterin synthase sulfur carrier subunit n=1 Tax=Caldimonas brevitalea TaxID=413882 RepID=A0A0G3BR78_9BURK|nr:molybdopterin converting factor subunit 1 [Caldimonas brevitalea]AKJ29055.1 molybdenum cofactor biosynthesis protein MoaD [Caldimonas brevitalea]
MKISVKYFASIREELGAGEHVELMQGATVGALRDLLIMRSQAHAEALARGRAVRMALQQTMCDESARLADGVEVAFFPPVTGG